MRLAWFGIATNFPVVNFFGVATCRSSLRAFNGSILIGLMITIVSACEKNIPASRSESNGGVSSTQDRTILPSTLAITGSLSIDESLSSGQTAENRPVELVNNDGDTVATGVTSDGGRFSLLLEPQGANLAFNNSKSASGSSQEILTIKSLFLVPDKSKETAVGVKDMMFINSSVISLDSDGKASFNAGTVVADKVGAIVGKITLETNEDPSGIDIYVPGTTHIAKTDNKGQFILGFLPQGTFSIRADRDGYGSLEWTDIVVKKNETTSIDAVTMRIATGPSVVSFEQLSHSTIALSSTVTLKAILRGSTKFRISQLSDFRDTIFRPVNISSNEMTITFQISGGDGMKSIFLEAADSDGLSVTTTLNLLLDTANPTPPIFSLKSALAKVGYTNQINPILTVQNCNDIETLYVTESSVSIPSAGQFNLTCVAALGGIPITISSTEGTKNLYLWAKDAAGRISTFAQGSSVKLDITAPVVHLTPDSGAYNSTVQVLATSDAESFIYYTLDLSTPSASSPTVSSSGSLQIVGDNTIMVKAIDFAGNESTIISKTFIIDREPPILGAITLASGGSLRNSLSIPLLLSCQGATKMRIAETLGDLNLPSASWSVYGTTHTYQLQNSGDGIKTIYVMFSDDAGNKIGAAGEYNVAFTLDRTPPAEGKIILYTPESPTGAFNAALAWKSLYSNESGMEFVVQVSTDATFSSAHEREMITSESSIEINPPLDNVGTYYWRMQPRDRAGNRPSWWMEAGESKKLELRVLAEAFTQRRELLGHPGQSKMFGRELQVIPDVTGDGIADIAISVMSSAASKGSEFCAQCGTVEIHNRVTGSLIATLTELLPAESLYGHKLSLCDIDNNGADELIVSAPGRNYVGNGNTYRNAGAIYAYNLANFGLRAKFERSIGIGDPTVSYLCNNGSCGIARAPVIFQVFNRFDTGAGQFFGWDMSCRRRFGPDSLLVGEPNYVSISDAGSNYGRVAELTWDNSAGFNSSTTVTPSTGGFTGLGTSIQWSGNFAYGSLCPAQESLIIGTPYKSPIDSERGQGGFEIFQVGASQSGAFNFCAAIDAPLIVGNEGRFGARIHSLGNIDKDVNNVDELAVATADSSGLLSTKLVRIYGSTFKSLNSADPWFGYAVESGGDFDGDGKSEVIVSSPGLSVSSKLAAGSVSIFRLSDIDSDDSNSDGDQDLPPFVKVTGIPSQYGYFGLTVKPIVGQTNNIHSQNSSLWIAAPGIFQGGFQSVGGASEFAMVRLAPTLPSRLVGTGPNALLGSSLAAIPDIDTDGVSDFIFGQPGARCIGMASGALSIFSTGVSAIVRDVCPGPFSGSFYSRYSLGAPLYVGGSTGPVYFGKVDESMATSFVNIMQNFSTLLDSNGVIGNAISITTDSANSTFTSMSAPLRTSPSGYDELLIGLPKTSYGSVRFYAGSGPQLQCSFEHGYANANNLSGVNFGYSSAISGDWNSDGQFDIIVGAPGFFKSAPSDGRIYVLKVNRTGVGNCNVVSQAYPPVYSPIIGAAMSGQDPITGTKDGGRTIRVIDIDNPAIKIALGGVRSANGGFGSNILSLPDLDGPGGGDIFFYSSNTNSLEGTSAAEPQFFIFKYVRSTNTLTVIKTEKGDPGSMLGGFARVISDVNGDGIGDLAISHPGGQGRHGNTGHVRIYSGAGLATDNTSSDDLLQVLFNPDPGSSNFGSAIEYGDITGDGVKDFVIGANQYDSEEYSSAGAVYIFSVLPIKVK